MPGKKIEMELEVRTYDIDIAGHVNNIVYVRWIEDLRFKLLETCCPVAELLSKNLYPVVTTTEVHYKRQLKLGDKPNAAVWLESISHGLMKLKAVFQKDSVTVATAEQECVLMDLQTGKMDKKAMEIYT